MTQVDLQTAPKRRSGRSRTARCRGSEVIEFTFVMLPMFVLIFALLNTAWAIFAYSTLQAAVRIGVRFGVTNQAPTGSDLTTEVKKKVQQSSLNLLPSGTSLIHVHYWLPPGPDSTAAAVDVSTSSSGNAGGNIMIVSVDGFSLAPLLPRIYNWKDAPDKAPLMITVTAADRIEPTRNPPPIGVAP